LALNISIDIELTLKMSFVSFSKHSSILFLQIKVGLRA
jgi:hypothetical protein